MPQRGWNQRDIKASSRPDVSGSVIMSEYRTLGATRRTWAVIWPGFSYARLPFWNAIDIPQAQSPESPALSQTSGSWGLIHTFIAKPFASPNGGGDHATGFPFMGAWYDIKPITHAGSYPVEGGILLGNAGNRVLWKLRALPLRPIWSGLLVNTAFYAALWFIPLGGVGLVRRRRRRRRGWCPGCAYDRDGLTSQQPCPECGLMLRPPTTHVETV